jgi:hypothetical protein
VGATIVVLDGRVAGASGLSMTRLFVEFFSTDALFETIARPPHDREYTIVAPESE